MSKREDAAELLDKLLECRPKGFFLKIDNIQKGIGFVLYYLDHAETEVIAGDIAAEMKVSTARMAALLKNMENNGFVTKHNSPQDARKTVVKITDKGKEYKARLREQILLKVEYLIERIGKEDFEEFIRLSRKIKNALDE